MNHLTINYDTFQKPKFIGATIMLLFGFALVDKYEFVGKFLMLTCVIPPFYNDGIQLNLEKKKYRYFTSYFGLKRGRWYSLSNYNYILIKHQKGTREIVGARGAIATTQEDEQFEVAITNKTHRKQLLLKHFTKKETAIQFAKETSENLSFPIVRFNPEISEKTKKRRRKSK